MPATASPVCEPGVSAPLVARQAGGREEKALLTGNRHHGAHIRGGIDALLDGGVGFGLGQKSHKLSF